MKKDNLEFALKFTLNDNISKPIMRMKDSYSSLIESVKKMSSAGLKLNDLHKQIDPIKSSLNDFNKTYKPNIVVNTEYVQKEADRLEETLSDVRGNVIVDADFTEAIDGAEKTKKEVEKVKEKTKDAKKDHDGYNNSVKDSVVSMKELSKHLIGLAGVYKGLSYLKSAAGAFLGFTDSFTTIQSRVSLMNDGLQTTDQLLESIRKSAMASNTDFEEMANTVATLGGTKAVSLQFGSSQSIVSFLETLNKMMGVVGTTEMGKSSVMLQLSQALGKNRLGGQELMAIREHMPKYLEYIEEYMGWESGSLGDHAEKGEITTEVMIGAMSFAKGEIDSQFGSISQSFSSMATKVKTTIQGTILPAVKSVIEFINSDRFQHVFNSILNGLVSIAKMVQPVVDLFISGFNYIYDNWSILSNVFYGVAVALGLLSAVLLGYSVAAAIASIASAGWAVPLILISVIIGGLVALLFLLVDAINDTFGTNISVVGVFTGALSVLASHIVNTLTLVYNLFSSVAELFINIFNEPEYAIKKFLSNILSTFMDFLLNGIVSLVFLPFKDDIISIFEVVFTTAESIVSDFVNRFIDKINVVFSGINSVGGFLNSTLGTDIGSIELIKNVDYTGTLTGDFAEMKALTGEELLEKRRKEIATMLDVGPAPENYYKFEKHGYENLYANYMSGESDGRYIQDYFDSLGATSIDKLDSVNGTLAQQQASFDEIVKNTKDSADNTEAMARNTNLDFLNPFLRRETINNSLPINVVINSTINSTGNSEYDAEKLNEMIDSHFKDTLGREMQITAKRRILDFAPY